MNETLSLETILIVLLLASPSMIAWAWLLRRVFRGGAPLDYESRSPVPWTGWHVVGLVAMTIVVMPLVVSVVAQIQGVTDSTDARLLAPSGVAELAAFLLAVLFLNLGLHASGSDLGFDLHRASYDLRVGVIAFLCAAPPVYFLNWCVSHWVPSTHPVVEMLGRQPGARMLVVVTILVVIVAPLVEEFFFRVLLQGWLEAREPVWRQRNRWLQSVPAGTVPVLGSSAVFALLHVGHGLDPVPLFYLSLSSGYVYHQTHRLLPSVVVHVCLNAATVVQLWILYLNPTS